MTRRREEESMPVRGSAAAAVVCVGLLILGICAGCREQPPVDASLLTGEPCEPPCWQGLTPGESTENEVVEFIRATKYVDPRTIYRGKVYRGGEVVGVSIQWRSTAAVSRSVESNAFVIEDGLLESIVIYPDREVTLENVVERYGSPEKFRAFVAGFHQPYVSLTVYYPTHGFTADLELTIDDPRLRPDSEVVRVWYFRAAPLERFVELACDAGRFSGPPYKVLARLRDWEGYGPKGL
jgi:hypothetical protein